MQLSQLQIRKLNIKFILFLYQKVLIHIKITVLKKNSLSL